MKGVSLERVARKGRLRWDAWNPRPIRGGQGEVIMGGQKNQYSCIPAKLEDGCSVGPEGGV